MLIDEVLTCVHVARRAAQTASAAAWNYTKAHEPVLAEALRSLGFGDDESGDWLITLEGNAALSPIELIAEGRAKELLDSINRAKHGFSA